MKSKVYSENIELINYDDMEGRCGFQMSMQQVGERYYLYCAHWFGSGIDIYDVTDPENLRHNYLPDPNGYGGTTTAKVQVADGIMIAQTNQYPDFLNPNPDKRYESGFQIWDVKTDPIHPVLLGRYDSHHPMGTHRNFYNGGKYVHCVASDPEYLNFIYKIIDISDPTAPKEVGRFAMEDQKLLPDGTPQGGWSRTRLLHMVYVVGNRAYLAYSDYGSVIVDISDPTNPTLVSQLIYKPAMGSGIALHSFIPITGTNYAVVSAEGILESMLKNDGLGPVFSYNFRGIVDISDETNQVLISIIPDPKLPDDPDYPYTSWHDKGFWYGPHNWHEPHDLPVYEDRPDRLYHCAFNAGLRIYDIKDPYYPKEIASYMPEDPKEFCQRQ